MKFDTETPSNLTAIFGLYADVKSSKVVFHKTSKSVTGMAMVLLRVICVKSAYFIFTVMVLPVFFACDSRLNTFSATGFIASICFFKDKISREKVFSPPIDFRSR